MEKKRADSISAVRSPRLNKLLRFYFLRFFRRTKLHGWEYDEITAVLGGARRKTRGKKRRGSFAPAVRGFHQDAKGMGLYMSDTAKPLRFFLGANTPQGFVSRFDQLADPTDGWREFVIKGGPGAGKSTLMKMITGWVKPDSGETIIGQTVKMGYFSQENEDMDQSMRVIDYIKNVAEYVRTADGLVSASQMLERFLFPSHMQYTLIGKLSGGERRRLYLLHILMGAPNVLLLDEPAAGLNPEEVLALIDFIRLIKERFQLSILVIEHRMDLIMTLCDTIYVQDFGRTIAVGPPAKIQKDPAVLAAYLGEEEV